MNLIEIIYINLNCLLSVGGLVSRPRSHVLCFAVLCGSGGGGLFVLLWALVQLGGSGGSGGGRGRRSTMLQQLGMATHLTVAVVASGPEDCIESSWNLTGQF